MPSKTNISHQRANPALINPIREWLREHRIDEVEAIIPDMTGIARGKIIPAAKYSEEAGLRLPEAIFLQTVTGEYPADFSVVSPTDRDIVLWPDPDTVRPVPCAADTVSVTC